MSGRWSVAIFTTCPNHPLPPSPPICENKGFGVGGAPQSQGALLGPGGGFKLIWVSLSFIFPTELSFSPDQNLYPLLRLQELRVPIKMPGIWGPHGMPTTPSSCCVGVCSSRKECTHKCGTSRWFWDFALQRISYNWYSNDIFLLKHTHDWYHHVILA